MTLDEIESAVCVPRIVPVTPGSLDYRMEYDNKQKPTQTDSNQPRES